MSESKEVEKGPAVSETEIDKSFYKVVLAERNLAWHQLEQAKVTIANLEERLAHQTDRTHNVMQYYENGIRYSGPKISLAIQIANTLVELEDEKWHSLGTPERIRLTNKVNNLLRRYRGIFKDGN